MACSRRRLPSIAAFWLSCHIALLMAPAVMVIAAPAALLQCTCTHGDHAICPMHHKPAAGSTICLIRSADHSSAGVLASIFTFVGILSPSAQTISPQPAGRALFAPFAAPSFDSSPPEAPPPRI